MNRTLKIYVFFLVLLLCGIVAIDLNRPKPIDWTPTYDTQDKNPLGLYVFNAELPGFLHGNALFKIKVTPYELLQKKTLADALSKDYSVKGTILNISDVNNLDDPSVQELFSFASRGNSIFLSMKVFPKILMDSLKFNYAADFTYNDKISTWLANPKLGREKFNLVEGMGNNYFSKIDTLNTTILGYQSGDSARVNFIKIPYKNGQFFLHTQPAAFTNFHLLKGNHSHYTEKVLSYLPQGSVFWCVKDRDGEVISRSPMRYILNHPALKWAWYIFIFGFAVFMFFNAKRRQRVVPVIRPLTNTTVDFAKTIGNLYFQEGDHTNLIDKKIIYFLDKVRQDYMIDTTTLDQQFIKKLYYKSGKSLPDIERLVYLINTHRKHHYQSVEHDLIEMDSAIEKITN